ncbi:MFS transporter [Arthrobacter sp. efr-133-TYG-118]|uniref:MFS transporter n=1 Tax=Arthrobacter sp. efr-133-TYG-118 TaxID=3040279 RepID=UPI0025502ADC|nr:MFS transporter [Arthrobacter sp. efr-133-TYG-118]
MKPSTPDSSDGKPVFDLAPQYVDENVLGRTAAAVAERVPVETTSAPTVRSRVSGLYVWMIVIATFGGFVALVAPIAISLAIRVQALEPAHEEYLGFIVGIGAAVPVLAGPLVGIWSDRTRSRFGRRNPFLIGGAVVGTVSLFVMAAATNIVELGIGWCLAQLGWGTVLVILTVVQADKLPEEQRGRVAGLVGFTQMVAPVLGAGIASTLVANSYLLFLVPGAFGVVGILLFVLVVKDPDTRELAAPSGRFGSVLRKYLYSPRKYKDFSWNWLARLLFNFGVTFNTTFTLFFITSRTGGTIADFAPFVAILGLGGVLAAAVGALGGGFLSDRLKRRRVFVLAAGVLFTIGALLMAFSSDLTTILVGTMITNVGLGAFSAVDQALLLDVLPERDTDAGRFMGINGFSTSLAQAIAPVLAPAILLIGVTGSDKNYTLLYVIAAAFTLVGGAIVVFKVKGTR